MNHTITSRLRRVVGTMAQVIVAGLVAASGLLMHVPVHAATIAYPDLQVKVPTSEISLGTVNGRRFLQFSHITWNSGTGPLEFRPSYNFQTGISQAIQALYTSNGNGTWTFATTVPIVKPMVFVAPDDYQFPFSQFGLYSVAADGGVGSLVAPSPKINFCMTPDYFVGGVPNTPSQTAYPPSNCDSPNGTLGLDVGWGDKYDYSDAGENIDITNVPDGTYWLRAVADPYHYFRESNLSNNETDTKITISGGQVTVLQQVQYDSTPASISLTTPTEGSSVSGTVTLTATVSGPHPVTSVQFLLDGWPLGQPVTSAPYTLAWNTASTTPGAHSLSAQVTDSADLYNTALPVSVNVRQVIGSFTVDAHTQATGTGTVSTTPFSTTAGGELLLAFVGSDGQGQTVTVSGAGLTWTLVKRANTQPGDVEIWQATAATALSNVTVTSTPNLPNYDQLLTVIALQGAAGVGHSATAAAATGAPSVSLSASAAGSWAVAVGNDYDQALSRTVGSGQALLSQFVDGRTGDTYWTQDITTTSTASGQTITLNDTAPTGDHWNMAVVEVLAGTPPPPPTDTTPPTATIVAPTDGQTVSDTTPVTVSASDNVAVASVQIYLDGHPLGPALTAAPYSYSWDTTAVSDGTHQLSATATDTSGNVGTAAVITVDVMNPPPPMTCFIMDVNTSVHGYGKVTTASFHTAQAGEQLLAFVASDGPKSAKQTVTVSGAGLTWKLVARANTQAGDAEIWQAFAPTVLTSAKVTSQQTHNGYSQSLTVIAMQGTDGLGATAVGSALRGAPSVSLTTTKPNSLVFGVGNDWDHAIARTLGPNQVLLNQYLDTSVDDTFWMQNTTSQAGPAGSVVTLNDTAPTTDRWNLAAVELIGAAE